MKKNNSFSLFMKKNTHWETILSVIIIIIIISIILVWMVKIIEYDNTLTLEYEKLNYTSLLENNTSKIVQKLDTQDFKEWDVFFLYKTGSTIQAFSGVENEDYKYINYLGEYVHSGSYKWLIYSRQCIIQKDTQEWQMIKCWVKELIKK